MPNVVVLSPYYNRGHLVERTVLSIKNQTYTDFEAYFVDDGSTDDTYAQLLRLSSQRVHACTQPNKGFTRTLIDTINETDSEFIAIQGSGDISLPRRLEKQVALLSENPDVVLVGCHRQQLSEIDGRTTTIRPVVETDPLAQLISENPFSQGEVIFRRSAYVKAGGYRSFFTYRQDLDLWLRLCAFGRFAIVPEVLYKVFTLRASVSHDVRKLSLAMACRDFAVFCARERIAGRADPLDQQGPVAALVRPRSRELANAYTFAAWRRAVKGDRENARYLLSFAFNEKRAPLGAWLTWLVIRLPFLAVGHRSLTSLKTRLRPIGQYPAVD